MNLFPDSKPKLGRNSMQVFREPKYQEYFLWVDCYEIEGATECGDKVFVTA